MKKVCNKCKKNKSYDDFHKQSKCKDGLRNSCKDCIKKSSKEYYTINKHVLIEKQKQYRFQNKNKIKEYKIKYREKNKEKMKKYAAFYVRNRYKTNINFKLRVCLASRIREALKFLWKGESTINLIGCSILELKKYIESKFLVGMSWNNYGFGDDKWNIDHIKPCDSFDLTDIKQQKVCFHYSNLQPLWQLDNLKKTNKLLGFYKTI